MIKLLIYFAISTLFQYTHSIENPTTIQNTITSQQPKTNEYTNSLLINTNQAKQNLQNLPYQSDYYRTLTTSSQHSIIGADSAITFTNYDTFEMECAKQVPVNSSDCTNKKYTGYYCCQVMYKNSNDPSYCTAFYSLVAKAQVLEPNPEFSFTCDCRNWKTINILLLMFLFLLIL